MVLVKPDVELLLVEPGLGWSLVQVAGLVLARGAGGLILRPGIRGGTSLLDILLSIPFLGSILETYF